MKEIHLIQYNWVGLDTHAGFVFTYVVGKSYTLLEEVSVVKSIKTSIDGFTVLFENGWEIHGPLKDDTELFYKPIEEEDADGNG